MNARILAATRKGLFFVERSAGGVWRIASVAFLGDNLSMVLPERSTGCIYAALGHGHFGVKLKRSCDGGKSWEECAAPAYPPPAPGEEPVADPVSGRALPAALELIWALESGGRKGELWCGTIPGGLFRSADNGVSWELNEALWRLPERRRWFGGGAEWPGIHSLCVDPRDPRRLHAGVSCGGVWFTEDGGASWECRASGMRAEYVPPEQAGDPVIQDPHRVVHCRSRPECLWAQHHNGIFKSTDGGASWSEVRNARPSAFGFAVAVHPEDPRTAWFVPAIRDEQRVPAGGKLVVSRTRDGGESFEVLHRGLPQEHAYDIAYRHALEVDSSGERLAFGTTTGSLYVSEDQGESWQEVSTHLPPIYCVRFEEGA
jgi:hypothetical protein